METFTAIDFHQPRDFGRKINATFEFLKQNFKPLMKSLLFIAGPPILIAGLLMGTFYSEMFDFSMFGRDPEAMMRKFTSINFWSQIFLMMAFYIVAMVASVATINNYIILYDEKKSNKIEVSEVWERVRSTFWMYLGTMLLFTILLVLLYAVLGGIVFVLFTISPALVFIGAVVIFCAAFYLLFACSLVFIIRGYEKIGFVDSISRSFYLIRGKWWSTFGLLMILYLIVMTISYFFMLPWYAITMVNMFHSLESGLLPEPSSNMKILTVVFMTLYYLVQMLLYALPNIGIAFQYFNLVERKESRALMKDIDTLGQVAPPAPSAEEHY